MAFSARAWADNLPIFEVTRDMPFNRELAAGTLSPERFQHYIVQDAHYLVAFGQTLAVAAAKADHPDRVAQFCRAAENAIAVERSLHQDFFRQFGLRDDVVERSMPSPTCHHYAMFLLATAFREPFPVVLAATLPCFWVYREVGRHIMAMAKPDNPYGAWIDAYGGEAFAATVDQMIAATDAAAEEVGPSTTATMHRAYRRAAQLEWGFWDAAYRLEQWAV